jgi:spore coat protein CotH
MTKIKEKEDTYLADTTAENLQNLKNTFETYFDVDNLVDYLIINDIINNEDAFASNWQWLTYDGVKWWCGLYDCNISFGYGGGQYTTADFRAPLTGHAGNSSNYMMRYIKAYYKDELEARYAFLRRNKVVTAEKIVYDIIIDWTNAVGYVNYTKEREKWANEVSVDNIYRLKKWVFETIQNLDALYHYNAN